MFAWKKIISKGSDHANSAPPAEKITYSLEAIMALQKSLECGFDDYTLAPKPDREVNIAAPKDQAGLLLRFTAPTKRFLRWLFLFGQEFPAVWKLVGNRENRQKKLGARLNHQAE